LADKGLLEIYWCHPAIMEQQSHNGKLPSLLDGKKHGILRRISYASQKLYKRIILFVQ
jgi:predicted glutamine amidotransferase